MTQQHRPLLSILVPMYNESEGLEALFTELIPVVGGVTQDFEILCINDGSRDDTLDKLKRWREREPRIHILSLSRNFGKEAALTAGLHHARGQAVIPIDADLQDPPELIPELVAKWKEGYKVVLATRRHRHGDSWLKRVTALGFYRLMQKMTTVRIPANTGDFRLMDASVIGEIKRLPERTRFMKGLFAWVGFSTATILYDRPARAHGTTKQNYRALWRLAKDGVFSFTTMPLRLSTYAGVVISALALVYGSFLAIRTLVEGADVPGYASIMVSVLFLGGIQLLSLGIIGEYVGRIYRETKQRPLYIVEESSGV